MFFVWNTPVRAEGKRPVLLYSRYYNAEGETRYLPEGSYRDILEALGETFAVRVHSKRPNRSNLRDVDLLLISNPSWKAIGTNTPPPHINTRDRKVLFRFVARGGGIILMGNQEDHNLERKKMNLFLARFGMQWMDHYTDAKGLEIPPETPVVGGLTWGYYTGNQIEFIPATGVQRWAVINDLKQPPLRGERDAFGILMAGVQYGKGRLVVLTDAGWINNSVLNGEGLGGVIIENDHNLEMMKRLCIWAASQ
ncbi:MAG: hypothetical protein P8L18_12840 [Verrucomicrobiota bacterium]|nr:hypothetical protein [Verrucomicrobiota bacterium]MDG1892190.1 hypothetical protein [Verrucomicrobiota bacterium]